MSNLTPKQNRFCEEYVIDWNGTQAAIRAGYSEKTAQEQSSRLLSNVIIQERISELKEKITEKNNITIQDLIDDLKELKIYGMKEESLLDSEGNETDRKRKVNPKCALEAIEKIGRMIGAFEKDNEQAKPNNLQIIVN